MLGEVIADEHVEQVGVAAQMSLCEGDELPVAGGGGVGSGTRQVVKIVGQEGGGHQQRWRGGVGGTLEDFGRRVGVVADQAVEEGDVVVGHTFTVDRGADGTLTKY